MTYDYVTHVKPAGRFEVAHVMKTLQMALDCEDPEVIEQIRDFMSQYAEELYPRGGPQDVLHIVQEGDEAGIRLSELYAEEGKCSRPTCQDRHGRQLIPVLAVYRLCSALCVPRAMAPRTLGRSVVCSDEKSPL